ncbi:hypothetical protein B0H13DRAFT_1949694 [Mycena leptocephala]|nr:hypothetical protein B0H13DRAFT_1949694 [Mycena leptocephala]
MSALTVTQVQPAAHKTRARALSLALIAASKTAPLLDIPTELGLEILELGLTHTTFSTLAAVSKAFSALIAIPDFLDTHIKTLAVTIEPWRFTPAARRELESIIAACTGIRAVSVTRPGILAQSLSHLRPHYTFPSEVTIQAFDAITPFEWEHSDGATPPCPAAHLSSSLTHLRISEPGDTWHSPLSILAFFGSTPHLTHLSLARRMDANTDNDQVFVDEVSVLLASRANLRMLVVRIFPAQWPYYFDPTVTAVDSSIWAALESGVSWAHVPAKQGGCQGGFHDFWESSRKEWEAQHKEELEQ